MINIGILALCVLIEALFCFVETVLTLNGRQLEEEPQEASYGVLKLKHFSVKQSFDEMVRIEYTHRLVTIGLILCMGSLWLLAFSGNWLVLLVVVMVFLILGIMVPKKLGQHFAKKNVSFLFSLVQGIAFVLSPIIWIGSLIASGILFLFVGKKISEEPDVTEEEILSMVNEGFEQGVLLDSEALMISNIMEFGDKEAKDIMTNRNNIHAFDASMPLGEVVPMIMEDHYSRFPVYEETIDHIIGFIYLKDAMRMQMHEITNQMAIGSIRRLLRKPVFVTDTKSIDSVFRLMQSNKTQMVVVIDEYGQTSGLLTLEDILEEIVGNIQDEFDEDDQYVIQSNQDGYVLSGTTPLEYLGELLKTTFEYEDFETINGLAISHMKHIPEDGEEFSFIEHGYEFQVLSSQNHRVEKIFVKRQKANPTEEKKED